MVPSEVLLRKKKIFERRSLFAFYIRARLSRAEALSDWNATSGLYISQNNPLSARIHCFALLNSFCRHCVI